MGEKRQFLLLKDWSEQVFQKCLINVCKNQEQILRKELTIGNSSRKKKLNKLLKFSTWIFMVLIQFLDYHLSSYRLSDSVLSEKQAMDVEFLQMSFQNHIHFRTEGLVQSYYWCCLQCLNGVSRCASPYRAMIAKIPRHASFPSEFPWNHLEHVQWL